MKQNCKFYKDFRNDQDLRKIQTCWEFMRCPKEIREKCKVYEKKHGRKCWSPVNIKKEELLFLAITTADVLIALGLSVLLGVKKNYLI